MFLLLGHSNIKNGNKQYIDKIIRFDWQSALGHTYYYRNAEKGYVISIRVNLNLPPFHTNTFKSAEDLSGIKRKTGTGIKQIVETNRNPGNTFKFTDDWYLACAEYMLDGAPTLSDGRYKLDDYSYKFIDFLFKDYGREYKYENDYIKKYIDNRYSIAPKNEYTPPSKYNIDPSIKIGGRNTDFEKARNCAAANRIPLFAVWTKVGCHFCTIFDKVLDDPKF